MFWKTSQFCLRSRWDWEKMCLSTGLYYYFSFCQVVRWRTYLASLAILYPSIWLLADALLAVSASSGPVRTQISQLPTLRKHTSRLFCVYGIISRDHLKGSAQPNESRMGMPLFSVPQLEANLTFQKNVLFLTNGR